MATIPTVSRGGTAFAVRSVVAGAVVPVAKANTVVLRYAIHLVWMVWLIGILTKAFSQAKASAAAAAAVSKAANRSSFVRCGPSLSFALVFQC
jgi:hypothetical protein